ncbi:hypothetical protein PybrP1_004236 [[Pythium] brassicae (nom. inval.)]|nr:hypothetical protein PybrP1_004236 [[Pythium] brassicae (nom. inval.)]
MVVAARDVALGALAYTLLSLAWTRVAAPWCQRRAARAQVPRGKVFLVGAGPGDVALLTMRARELLSVASVAVVDDLVRAELYALLPRDCEVVYVGKRGGKRDSARQTDIDALLVAHCRAGRLVVRVKGGDPMVFGRVHSEIRALCRAGCAFEVVPGISSALAAPSVVHIPITHKRLSRSFVILSGHKPAEMDFAMLARVDTLVLLMATRTLGQICEQLVAAGRDAATPVALVHAGTTPEQVMLLGSLADIAATASARSYSPAIVVVGAVAKYADVAAYLQEEDDDDEQDTTV